MDGGSACATADDMGRGEGECEAEGARETPSRRRETSRRGWGITTEHKTFAQTDLLFTRPKCSHFLEADLLFRRPNRLSPRWSTQIADESPHRGISAPATCSPSHTCPTLATPKQDRGQTLAHFPPRPSALLWLRTCNRSQTTNPRTHATMVATQEEKKQKTCPRETYQQFCAAKFGSGSTTTVQSYQKDDALKKELREKFHAACDSFGFDQVDAPYDATAALFADNTTLAELYNVRPKGEGSAKSGASSTAHRSGVTYDEGLACAAMVEHFKVSDALEIGLAYGHSALFTACALPAHGTLVAVDPAQAMGADEGGWEDKGAQVRARLHSNPHHPPPRGIYPHPLPFSSFLALGFAPLHAHDVPHAAPSPSYPHHRRWCATASCRTAGTPSSRACTRRTRSPCRGWSSRASASSSASSTGCTPSTTPCSTPSTPTRRSPPPPPPPATFNSRRPPPPSHPPTLATCSPSPSHPPFLSNDDARAVWVTDYNPKRLP